MCVTNTAYRRSQPISFAAAQVKFQPNDLSQLVGSAFPSTAAAPVASFMPLVPTPAVQQSAGSKPRPKRRRKPQKPGKTAKMNDRHFVVHNYHDHANDTYEEVLAQEAQEQCGEEQRRRGGVAVAFPIKLHEVLEQVEADGLGHIISWQAHGRCFVIHNPKEFVDHIMPQYVDIVVIVDLMF